MEKNIEFTDEELEILHSIVIKEKSGLKHMNCGTLFGKKSLDNYFKDLNDLQLKIEKVKKEKIEILIVTNTIKQAIMKTVYFIEKLSKKVDDFELGKKGITWVAVAGGSFNSVVPVGLTVKFDKFYKHVTIEVEGDKEVKEISIKFMGSQQTYDGMRFDSIFIDYNTFYVGKFSDSGISYSESITKKVVDLEQKLLPLGLQSKYYQKELPQLVKMLLD